MLPPHPKILFLPATVQHFYHHTPKVFCHPAAPQFLHPTLKMFCTQCFATQSIPQKYIATLTPLPPSNCFFPFHPTNFFHPTFKIIFPIPLKNFTAPEKNCHYFPSQNNILSSHFLKFFYRLIVQKKYHPTPYFWATQPKKWHPAPTIPTINAFCNTTPIFWPLDLQKLFFTSAFCQQKLSSQPPKHFCHPTPKKFVTKISHKEIMPLQFSSLAFDLTRLSLFITLAHILNEKILALYQ